MNKKTELFGTDGIRGIANKFLTPSLCYKVGKALAILTKEQNGSCVLIGGDTRLSTDSFKFSIVSGLLSHGVNVVDAGILPTPAVSNLCTNKYDYAIMITASHNPPQDNGIKIFDNFGNKLSEQKIAKLQYIIDNADDYGLQTFDKLGKYNALNLVQEYCDNVVKNIAITLDRVKVAIDCSFGACSTCASKVFESLKADYTVFNSEYTGLNINKDCGALHPEFIRKTVEMNDFDIGFAYDGDGDRVVCVLKDGRVLDGDSILYVLARYMQKLNMLYGNTVVATVLSNFGLEHSLKKYGIKMLRTAVGDKNVSTMMQSQKLALGGEKAGHIIFGDFSKTGDGIFISVLLLKLEKITGIKIGDILNDLILYPYVEDNVVVPFNKKQTIIEAGIIKTALDECLQSLADKGRIVLRPSGTENKIRILVEGQDNNLNAQICSLLREKIELAVKYL